MFIKEVEENIQPEKAYWQMTKEELKAILDNYVGNFETQLNAHKKNKFLKNPPDCGMAWLRDIGVLRWYLENGWIAVFQDGFVKNKKGEKTNRKKWRWALTEKYISERIPEKESVLDELMGRRLFREKENAIAQIELVRSM